MTQPLLKSERLLLLPLAATDAPAIQRLFPQWEIVRFLGNRVPWPYPDDGARQFVEEGALPAMAEGRHMHWTLRLKEAPAELIGLISLRPYDESDDQRGFWLDPRQHRRGLMFEAAERVTEFAFTELKVEALTVSNAEENQASARIKERQGARLVRTVMADFVSGRLPKQVWELRREDWLARRS